MNTFKRIEKKYWLNKSQYDFLNKILDEHFKKDDYGLSTIYSLYFDVDNYSLINKSIEGLSFKEKLRVRSYGPPDKNDVYIEIKRKSNGIGYKRRIKTDYIDALNFLNEKREPNSQIEKEILSFQKRYKTKPRILITYKRYALYSIENKNLRITFDFDLRYKDYTENMNFKSEGNSLILDENKYCLMEIKSDSNLPIYLVNELSSLKIYHSSFSKVGYWYKEFLMKGKIKNVKYYIK